MQQFIEAKVKYEKVMENGLQKKVSEPYLVDALSFTEAEKRITDEVSSYISGVFEVCAVKKSNIKEIWFSDDADADRFYKAKVQFITIDERTEQEKRSNNYMLVQAGTIKDALSRVEKEMNGTMIDYVITSIAETQIMDVFVYQGKSDE